MNTEARHRISGDALRTALEGLLGKPVQTLQRRFCAYSSSYTLENIDVTLARGQKLRLVLKDVSPPSVLTTAQQVRPRFLYNPARESEVYQTLLNPARHGTARCVGAVNSPHLEWHWIFLERVDGFLLWQVGDLAQWDAAARWLAAFHTEHAGRKGPRSENLLKYDADFFAVWMERAEKFLNNLRVTNLKKFTRLASRYDRVVTRLAAMPTTLIHGEFYPSNVIVRPGAAAQTICAVDWEVAGIGPGALDLAALTAGQWSESEKRRFVTAYHGALNSRDPGSVEDLLEVVELCQLHLSVQMLGWAENWSPPDNHTQNWLGTALRLADKLGI